MARRVWSFFIFKKSDKECFRLYFESENTSSEKSFKEEYTELLTKFEIDYKDEYLFDFFD